jgi:hypothetical protein
MDYPEADRFMETAINDALAALPKATSADKIADWLWANRWPSFPDGMKYHVVQKSLRRAFCDWAERQANYYARLGDHRQYSPPNDDDIPF